MLPLCGCSLRNLEGALGLGSGAGSCSSDAPALVFWKPSILGIGAWYEGTDSSVGRECSVFKYQQAAPQEVPGPMAMPMLAAWLRSPPAPAIQCACVNALLYGSERAYMNHHHGASG
jgi:hypothetical protein